MTDRRRGPKGPYSTERIAASRRARWGESAYPSRIDKSAGPDACWPWAGGRHSLGYGLVHVRTRPIRVHRLVLEEKIGRPIAPGMEACHTCDNPPCCNPAHLYEGTHAQNMADMAARGRTTRGERQKNAKLTAVQVAEIRSRAGLEMQTSIAARYGVSPSLISLIHSGKLWAA